MMQWLSGQQIDPANQIYMSYEALHAMVEKSTADTDTALHAQTRGTYVFENVEAYDKFEAQARKLGLSDMYTVSSEDVAAYEQSLAPLENLSTYAGYFLAVVLLVGGVIDHLQYCCSCRYGKRTACRKRY